MPATPARPGALALTIDVDWAPDFMIESVAQTLVDRGVRATWLVTHRSSALNDLAAHPELFELGVHPNFLPGSSHGACPDQVLETVLDLVPGATTMRTHALVQSTPILHAAARTSIDLDLSLFLPRAGSARPFVHWMTGSRLWRLPYVWEDDLEFGRPDPDWTGASLQPQDGTVAVLDFHPVHVWLNSSSIENYARVKQACPDLRQVRERDTEGLVAPGQGTRTMFERVVTGLAGGGGGATCRELLRTWPEPVSC